MLDIMLFPFRSVLLLQIFPMYIAESFFEIKYSILFREPCQVSHKRFSVLGDPRSVSLSTREFHKKLELHLDWFGRGGIRGGELEEVHRFESKGIRDDTS